MDRGLKNLNCLLKDQELQVLHTDEHTLGKSPQNKITNCRQTPKTDTSLLFLHENGCWFRLLKRLNFHGSVSQSLVLAPPQVRWKFLVVSGDKGER